MTGIGFLRDGRRWLRLALFVFCTPLLVFLLSSSPPAAAQSSTAILTIINEANVPSASPVTFTMISPELIWGGDVVNGGSTGFEICTEDLNCKGGVAGSGDGQFISVLGLAVDTAGRVFAADHGNHRVQAFTSGGSFLKKWPVPGGPTFTYLQDLAVDANGMIYVADGRPNNRVVKFDFAGQTTPVTWGTSGSGAGQFNYPVGIDLDTAGDVYVFEHYNYRIQKFTNTGTFLRTWGWDVVADEGVGFEICTPGLTCKAGVRDGGYAGQFYGNGVAVETDRIYVSDGNNSRIQVFDAAGNFLIAWGWDVVAGNAETGFEVCTNAPSCKSGAGGNGDGQFNEPWHLAVDGAGNVYVTDRLNHRIQKFDRDGNFLLKWGTLGGARGQLNDPRGITIDDAGNVFVAETSGNRIQKFSQAQAMLSDGQNATFNSLAPGNHVISELVPEGWPTPGISCTGGGPQVSGNQATLTLAAGDDVTCTFTNTLPNQPPTAVADAYSVNDDQVLVVPAPGVLGNDSDPESDPLTAVLVEDVDHGALTLNADGSFTYTPVAGYSGEVSFTYKANDGSADSNTATVTIDIDYPFTGFFQPVDNLPVFNKAKAGSAIPVKFSLGDDYGLDILAAGYPVSKKIACESGALIDGIEVTVTAGSSSLQYDPLTGQYTYVWKTDKTWTGTCRQFELKLVDGTSHMANFTFK